MKDSRIRGGVGIPFTLTLKSHIHIHIIYLYILNLLRRLNILQYKERRNNFSNKS